MCHVLRTSRSCLGSRRSRCLGTWCPVPPRNRSDLSVRRRSTFACARKARRALPLCSGDQHSPTTREPSPPRWPIVRYLCLILLTCHRLRLGSSQRAERRRAVEFRSVATVVTSRMHKVDAGFDRSLADEACAAVLDGKPSRTVRRRGDLPSLNCRDRRSVFLLRSANPEMSWQRRRPPVRQPPATRWQDFATLGDV